jgi:hypothetical protein
MPEVLASAVVPADPDGVWRVVRDFGGIADWHPGIDRSVLEGGADTDQIGAIRSLGLGDGSTVIELLVGLDDTARALTYEIVESPFPVRLYRSTIRVVPVTTTGESFVEWSLVFDCDAADADRLIELFGGGVFTPGLQGLAAHFAPGTS